MEHITIGNIIFEVRDIKYLTHKLLDARTGTYVTKECPTFELIDNRSMTPTCYEHLETFDGFATLAYFHGAQFMVLASTYQPRSQTIMLMCHPDVGVPYNPLDNVIENAIADAVREHKPFYGLADEIQEDLEEKQFLSQMRYLM